MNAAKHRLYGISDFSLLINYCIRRIGIIYVLFIFSGPTKNKYHHIILRSTPMLAFCSVIKLFISFVHLSRAHLENVSNWTAERQVYGLNFSISYTSWLQVFRLSNGKFIYFSLKIYFIYCYKIEKFLVSGIYMQDNKYKKRWEKNTNVELHRRRAHAKTKYQLLIANVIAVAIVHMSLL